MVHKHIRTLPKYWNSRPVAKHTAEAFEEALDFVLRFNGNNGEGKEEGGGGGSESSSLSSSSSSSSVVGRGGGGDSSLRSSSVTRTKVILDSGCGTGRSSLLLGEKYPDCVVIGVE